MKLRFHLYVLAVLLLLKICPAFAQDLRFNKVIQVEDMPHDITGITQDRDGNIWFSAVGIFRYDGIQLKTYSNDRLNPNSIASNRVICIMADKSGNIWAGTHGSGLDKFDPKTGIFTHFKHIENDTSSISSDTVISIIQDREGIIWLGTEQGLNRLDPATGKFTHYRHKENDPASLSFDQVGVVYEDKKGDLWIGCGGPFFDNQPGKNGGLNRMDKKSGRFTRYLHNEKDPHSLIDNRVRAILEDSHGNFWVGTVGDGLHTMNRDSGTFQRHTYDHKNPGKLSRPPLGKFIDYGNDHITFINEDITGNIWIGTFEGGLTKYDPALKKITRYNSQNSNVLNFSDSTTWCSFNSRDGVLWIGAWDNGLYWVDPSHQDIQHTEIKTGRSVLAYIEDGPVQYIGTDSGLLRIDKKNNSRQLFLNDPKNQESISDKVTFTLLKDSKNRIWAGTSGSLGGLNLYNREKQSFTRYKHDPKDSNSLTSDFVFDLYEDHQSNLWVGTLKGLDKMNPEKGAFTHYKPFPDDTVGQRNLVACILEDSKQNIWFGNLYEGGLHLLDQATGKVKNYLIRHNILRVIEDSDGKLWAGADDGLYSYDQALDSFSLFIDPSSGISFTTLGIAEDNHKNLWLSSPLGLYRINKDRNEVSRFSKNFGLSPITFSGIGLYTSAEGQMIINTVNGYYSFFPDKITTNLNPPEIVFTDFRVANQQVKPDKVSSLKEDLYQAKPIELSYNQDAFSFLFNVIHFSNPNANRAIYMLENYDKQWRNAGSERTAYYYNIPPGEYRFRIKAASSNGVWTEKSITVLVRPPWWRSWWASLLYVFILVGIAIFVHHALKRRVIFQERERTRSRELMQAKEIEKAYHELKTTQGQLIQSEKMASLGELTAGIAHEIRNPLNFVNNFSEINAELIDDLEKEADKGNMQEVKSIAKDIKENSEKINHHGKRADSIVKGMLQHSNSNNAVKEPTDINRIADEYLRLAYHGLRAKDKSFNAVMKTNYDASIGPITVIPQEIGRVFLNIINNAFYVVAEKKKQSLNGYEPTVSIETKKKNGQVEISIKDNGNGIPPKALDKIFQPFFTTKPTGQGTGLGLSLSYDIIKAHGGEINVQTKEGEGTEFIIQLPITT